MNNADFWKSINGIIADGFTSEGLQKLDHYAELFINGRLVYKRFSPFEQHGCATGGATNVIASLLAGADAAANCGISGGLSFQAECQRGKAQEDIIERWAKKVNCWYDNVEMGFELRNPRNWTYATPDIYLSDLHDENVILSREGNVFVVDCDIRINTPQLRAGGTRTLTTEVDFL